MSSQNCIDTISPLIQRDSRILSWKAWFKAGRQLVSRELLTVAEWLARAHRRSRSRRALLSLDRRLLEDIGISPYDAVREAEKPFWRD